MDIIKERKKIFFAYMIYFISMSIFVVIKIMDSYGVFKFGNDTITDVVYSLIVQIGVMLLLPLILYACVMRPKKKEFLDGLNIHKVNYKIILLAILAGVIVFVLNMAVSTLFSNILSFMGYQNRFYRVVNEDYYSVKNFFVQLAITAVLPAFCEEFMHRGFLLCNIKKVGFKKAILITSLLFGLVHFNINQVFYAAVLGIIIALICVVCRSIVPCIIIHFMNNGISTYLEFAEHNKWFLGNFFNTIDKFFNTTNKVLIFFICFVVIAALVVALSFLIIGMFKVTTLNKVRRALNEAFEGDIEKDMKLTMRKTTAWREVLENSGSLNLNYGQMRSPLDYVLPPQRHKVKTNTRVNIFLYASIMLGVLITLFTFLWGVL